MGSRHSIALAYRKMALTDIQYLKLFTNHYPTALCLHQILCKFGHWKSSGIWSKSKLLQSIRFADVEKKAAAIFRLVASYANSAPVSS